MGAVQIALSDCDYALWLDIYPFVADRCNYLEADSFGSYMVECASNGNSATITQYDDYACDGNVINTTSLTNFYCDASGDDCDPIVMSVSRYLDSSDCSGGEDKEGEWYFPPFNNECVELEFSSGSSYGSLYTIDEDGFVLTIYFDSDCNGTIFDILDYEDGECTAFGGSSTQFSFSQDTSGGSTEMTTTNIGTTDDSGSTGGEGITTDGSSGEDDGAIFYNNRKGYFTFLLLFSFGIALFLEQ